MKLLALSGCVPQRKVDNLEAGKHFGKETASKIVASTGIKNRYIASPETCTSDLCAAAAEKLFDETSITRESIDAVVFVTQTPDFLIPSTSNLLQSRLGLKEDVFAIDISNGCSGFTHGLLIANGLLSSGFINRVILFCGDTLSKTVSAFDQGTALLFGDAATATVIEAGKGMRAFISGTDGTGNSAIQQKCGYRNGFEKIALEPEKALNDKSHFRLQIDGAKVFGFTIKRIPKLVFDVLEQAEIGVEDIDAFVFHQANQFMLDYLSKKMKLPKDRVPISLDVYGNTSSASIPLTLLTECRSLLSSTKSRFLLGGFGVGLNWSAVVLETSSVKTTDLVKI